VSLFDYSACPVCSRELVGDIIQIGPNKYHQGCFKCSKCHNPVIDGRIFLIDGKAICDKCKANAGGLVCAACNKPIIGKGLEALDMIFHPSCFVCDNCKKPFPGGNFIELDRKPYCQPCADEIELMRAERCTECKKPLQGKVTRLFGKYWHFGCYKCSKCRQPIIDAYYSTYDRPLCLNCLNSDINQVVANTTHAPFSVKEGAKKIQRELPELFKAAKIIGERTPNQSLSNDLLAISRDLANGLQELVHSISTSNVAQPESIGLMDQYLELMALANQKIGV